MLLAYLIYILLLFVCILLFLTLIGLTWTILDNERGKITAFYTYDIFYEEDSEFIYISFIPFVGFKIRKNNEQ